MSGTKPTPLQPNIHGKGEDKISLIFVSENKGEEITGCDLSLVEFEAILRDAAKRGENVGSWLCRALNETEALQSSAERNGKAKAPAVAGAGKPKKEWTPEQLEEYRQMRHRKFTSAIQLHQPGIYLPELSDAQLLDFISLVAADNETALRRIADASRDDFWKVQLAEAITAAITAARRARWEGLKSAPTDENETLGRRRAPLLLDLRGLSGSAVFDDRRLLTHICSALYHFRAEIRDTIQCNLIGRKEAELIDAMALAELVEDRGGGLEEVETAQEKHQLTELQKEVWMMRGLQALLG